MKILYIHEERRFNRNTIADGLLDKYCTWVFHFKWSIKTPRNYTLYNKANCELLVFTD